VNETICNLVTVDINIVNMWLFTDCSVKLHIVWVYQTWPLWASLRTIHQTSTATQWVRYSIF